MKKQKLSFPTLLQAGCSAILFISCLLPWLNITSPQEFLRGEFSLINMPVQTAVTEIGTKSFHLAQRVIDTETQEIKCICTSIMVAFNLEKHESKPLEEEWIRAICKYEGRDLRKKK